MFNHAVFEDWGSNKLDELLPLEDAYTEDTALGFLLRHYWLPATTLQFEQHSRLTRRDGSIEQDEIFIDRKLARCRSNECVWREKGWRRCKGSKGETTDEIDLSYEQLCSYNCHEQTFRVAKPVTQSSMTPIDSLEAKREAILRLPILAPPPCPMLLGFRWRGEAGDDYMDYLLESEQSFGSTSVLLIRRKGRLTTTLADVTGSIEDAFDDAHITVEREGVTSFAWKRGAVLEDRYSDSVIDNSPGSNSLSGATRKVVLRLVKSSPTETTSTFDK